MADMCTNKEIGSNIWINCNKAKAQADVDLVLFYSKSSTERES